MRMAVLHIDSTADLPLMYEYDQTDSCFRTLGYVRIGPRMVPGVEHHGADTGADRDAFLAKVLHSLAIPPARARKIVRAADHPSDQAEPVTRREPAPARSTAQHRETTDELHGLRSQGDRLSNAGDFSAAVGVRETAVRIARGLNDDLELATDLSRLAHAYLEDGRSAEAVQAMEESVRLFRLVSGRNSWYERVLAMELLNLGLCMEKARRRKDAVRAVREAARIFRAMALVDARFAEEAELSRRELRRQRRLFGVRGVLDRPRWWTVPGH